MMRQHIDYNDIKRSIGRLLDSKESDEVEFKSAAGGFPVSFWETYSSFANTNGGLIVFGVKEKHNSFLLDGLTEEQVEKYRRDFFNNMHSRQNANLPLLKESDVEEIKIKDSYLLLFYIPRVSRDLKPVFCGQDPYSGTYRRDEDGDYHCTREEVNSMFADANLANPIDGRIMENYGLEDLDDASINEYRQLFVHNNPDHVWNALPKEKFLEKLNVIRTDRTTHQKGITFAGLLMFGTYSALTDADPNFFPDYQEIVDPKDRWINRIYPDGNWESNLFQFYKRVLPILQSFLPKPFKLEGNLRVNETSAHIAVREALTNALVHADYTENATLNVYKYPNKIVFSNPGTMLISKQQYYKGGESICRNKYLQTIFTFLGTAEKAGSGADKIVHGWEEQNWKRPDIEETARPNKVILTMTMESLLDPNTIHELKKLYGEDIERIDRHELMILSLALTEKEITNERLQYALDMHRSDITHVLNDMCGNHLLESTGYGRGTRYHLFRNKVALPTDKVALPADKVALPSDNVALPADKDTLPADNDALPSDNDALPADKDTLPADKDTLPADKDTLPTDKVALPGNHRKRFNMQELKENIADFCKEWKSIEEIAAFVGRTKEYIKSKVLPKMTDILEKKYNVPHHPQQRYKTKNTLS